ncbi:MAG: NADPH:quinone oxidoreductase [Marmoricola sp.]|nr:NADPH:quinone oxidoreductase [Marmoricola sp.]
MRAVRIVPEGDDGRLEVVDMDSPRARADEVVVEVAAGGVNRADTIQRRGRYAPPPGASPIPGLECSGTVIAVGAEVTSWNIGDEVCALLAGGGYAEQVAVPADQVLAAPAGMPLVDAAALPEAMATAWSNLVGMGRLRAGERVLVHGGSSGVGTMAIQIARMLGAEVFVTVGSPDKEAACRALGAAEVINYRTEDFVERVHHLTGGTGVDVVLDLVGAAYARRNVDALAVEGRLVIIGLQSGSLAEVELRQVLLKRVVITGSLLRSRTVRQKAAVLRELERSVLPHVESGQIRPVIDSVLTLDRASEAHAIIESSRHIGKILLTPR